MTLIFAILGAFPGTSNTAKGDGAIGFFDIGAEITANLRGALTTVCDPAVCGTVWVVPVANAMNGAYAWAGGQVDVAGAGGDNAKGNTGISIGRTKIGLTDVTSPICNDSSVHGVWWHKVRVDCDDYADPIAPPAQSYSFVLNLTQGGIVLATNGTADAHVTVTLTDNTTSTVLFSATATLDSGTLTASGWPDTWVTATTTNVTATYPDSSIAVTVPGGDRATWSLHTHSNHDDTNPAVMGSASVQVNRRLFFFRLSSNDISVSPGSSSINTVGSSLDNGATQPVSLACTSGLPVGVSCGFNPAVINPPSASTLTITTTSYTPLGQYYVMVTGRGGGLAQTTIFLLTITSPVSANTGGGGRPVRILAPMSTTPTGPLNQSITQP